MQRILNYHNINLLLYIKYLVTIQFFKNDMCFDYKDWRNTLTDIISGCKYSYLVHYNTLLLLFCSSKLFNSKGGSHSTPLYLI